MGFLDNTVFSHPLDLRMCALNGQVSYNLFENTEPGLLGKTTFDYCPAYGVFQLPEPIDP